MEKRVFARLALILVAAAVLAFLTMMGLDESFGAVSAGPSAQIQSAGSLNIAS